MTTTHMPTPVGAMPIRQEVIATMADMSDRQIADQALRNETSFIDPEYFAELAGRGLTAKGWSEGDTYAEIHRREQKALDTYRQTPSPFNASENWVGHIRTCLAKFADTLSDEDHRLSLGGIIDNLLPWDADSEFYEGGDTGNIAKVADELKKRIGWHFEDAEPETRTRLFGFVTQIRAATSLAE